MAYMEEHEIAETFASDIRGVVEDWFWDKSDAIKALQELSEIEDDNNEISILFWQQVTKEGDFIDEFFENENSWMEPGVAYTMNSEGEFESWDNPYKNY